MIEIAFDKNKGNTFLNRPCPVFTPSPLPDSAFASYRREARKLLDSLCGNQTVIIDDRSLDYSRNLFAVALFVEAYENDNGIECAVFKTDNYEEDIKAYKPFVALTVGLKYVMRLFSETPLTIYKEISDLGYLGLDVSEDYRKDKLYLKLKGTAAEQKIIAEDTAQALMTVGILKALALAHTGASFDIEINIPRTPPEQRLDRIIEKIVDSVLPWISKQHS